MEVFRWVYHQQRTRYPDAEPKMKLGSSWDFASKPESPYQREFSLKLQGLRYYFNPDTGFPDGTQRPALNALLLQQFYERHGTWKSFAYRHPVLNWVKVRFKDPLDLPYGLKGGDGIIDEVEITLVEVPGMFGIDDIDLPPGLVEPVDPGAGWDPQGEYPDPVTGPENGITTDAGDYILTDTGDYLTYV